MATLLKQMEGGFVASPLQAALSVAADDDDGMEAKYSKFCIVAYREGTRPSYVLIAAADVLVRVNGSTVVGGIRVLQHKDELVIGTQQMFFSADSTPVVEVYQHEDSERRPRCPVCRAEIQDGQSVVHCPGCSRLYHQIDATDDAPAKPCWTYSLSCRFCAHPTSMSGEPTWRPDEEELLE